jgi:hypothetical protein
MLLRGFKSLHLLCLLGGGRLLIKALGCQHLQPPGACAAGRPLLERPREEACNVQGAQVRRLAWVRAASMVVGSTFLQGQRVVHHQAPGAAALAGSFQAKLTLGASRLESHGLLRVQACEGPLHDHDVVGRAGCLNSQI